MTRRLVILGSSGSIGTQALDIVDRHPGRFEVVGLAVGSQTDVLCEQAERFRPRVVAVVAGDPPSHEKLPPGTEVLAGPDALVQLAAGVDCDIVLNGVVGAVGLEATVAALAAGRTLALANKESLVAGGPVVRRAREAGGGEIVPVDSEHAASAQLLAGENRDEVARLVLTASGGPFRGRSRAELADVTVEQALAHPTWDMGAVITINSATLMNKALELLEARELFDFGFDRLGAVVHPQSIVHAIVEFVDGSSVAHVSHPDMRNPIGWALSYPDRLHDPIGKVSWSELPPLEFEEPDLDAFPLLGLAAAVGAAGGTAPAVFNAANEVVVDAFLKSECGFLDIPRVVADVLDGHDVVDPRDVAEVVAAGDWARSKARDALGVC